MDGWNTNVSFRECNTSKASPRSTDALRSVVPRFSPECPSSSTVVGQDGTLGRWVVGDVTSTAGRFDFMWFLGDFPPCIYGSWNFLFITCVC